MSLKEDRWMLCYRESVPLRSLRSEKKKSQLMLLPLAGTIVPLFAVSQ